MANWWRQVVGGLVLASLLVACGNSDSVGAPGATPTPNAPAEEATSAAGSADAQPTTLPQAGAAEAQPAAEARVALRPVADGFEAPLYATHAADGSGRIFVVEKRGTIRIVRDGQRQQQSFLDITERVGSDSSEQGLLSVAFHPQYRENGLLFVNYTDRSGDTVVSRFNVTSNADQADAASERVLLTIDQPAPNHNGGLVKFGPDGYLYIGMGDGGRGGDPWGNAQNPDELLGKMLRIDVNNGDPYAIPADNPFRDGGARPEIWALGLRNPWRFSFDRNGGDLYIADVGQNAIEEVNVQPLTAAGLNYGWDLTEGLECYDASGCDTGEFVLPASQYTHDEGCSVTGGYVYRGTAFPALAGLYFFGDYCSGRVWMLRQEGDAWQRSELLQTGLQISSFGEDEPGELYLTGIDDGTLYQVVSE